jgi:hypothetical protein
MAIIEWPDDISADNSVQCSICKQNIIFTDVTTGLLTVRGEQTFICDAHLGVAESLRYVRAGIDFLLEQKKTAY